MWDGSIAGLDFNPALVLHGEQSSKSGPAHPHRGHFPQLGSDSRHLRQGQGSLLVLEVESRTAAGDPLFVNRYSLFLRGEGGFGGDPGPKDELARPTRDPIWSWSRRLCLSRPCFTGCWGTRTPPRRSQFAAFGGFERPILHGLCSYGIACKAVVDSMLGGNTAAVAATGCASPG